MIWCLHGFLGEGRDWYFLSRAGFEIEAPDLFAAPLQGSIEGWSARFADSVAAKDNDPFLVGYSLGGRLGLHALLARPELFHAAVIVSASLGIEGANNQSERRRSDEEWARRFQTEEWSSVVREWNVQPLFRGAPLPSSRAESRFDRSALAHALRAWSPAVHEPLLPRLRDIAVPILWVAGQRDAKYVAEARKAAAELQRCQIWICPRAGHRVPWEQPELLLQRIRSFLRG